MFEVKLMHEFTGISKPYADRMKKSISTDLTSANIAKIMEVLAESPARLEAMGRAVSAKKLRQPLGEGRAFVRRGFGAFDQQ